MEQLHPKAVWLFFLRFFFAGLFLLLWTLCYCLTLLGAFIKQNGVFPILLSFVLFLLIYFYLCYLLAKLSYRYWRYEFTDNAIKIEKGIIFKKYISIPYERVQNVDIYRGPLARLLGLSDLHIQTAGYSGGKPSTEGRLPGLYPTTAEQLREELIKRVEGKKQGL